MAKRFKEEKSYKKIVISILLLVLIIALILESSFAFFSDYIMTSIGAISGTVRLEPINFLVDGEDKPIENWKPGDVTKIEWTVENAGNKSIYTKSTLEIAWDLEENLSESKVIYLYPDTMEDEEIRKDIITNNGANAINIGNDQKTIEKKTGIRNGYKYTFLGNILDGVGTGAEIGDSRTPDSDTHNLLNGEASQTLKFKLAFSSTATPVFQNLPVYVNVTSEAFQFRNNVEMQRSLALSVSKIEKEDLLLYLDANRSSNFSTNKNIWYDLSGNNNDFMLYNSPIIANNAVEFNGSNQYARSINKMDFSQYDSITVEVIVRTNDTYNLGMVYEHTSNWNGFDGAFGLAVNCHGNGVEPNLHHTNHKTELARNYYYEINTNWSNHVNIFSRINDNEGRLTYVNSELLAFTSEGGYGTDTNTTNGMFTNDYMFLGARNGAMTFLSGKISSIRIYGRKLTQEEIINNYNEDKGKVDLP